MSAILGKKIGMTQVFDEEGTRHSLTVIAAGPCPVTQIKTRERDGYEALQIGFEEVAEKKISKPERGHLKKAGAPVVRHLAEIELIEGLSPGEAVTVERFSVGEVISVSGISQGKGFAGTVKRHNFSRGPVTHGSHNTRAPGSIGASAYPSRVFKGLRGPGHMGARKVTQKGLKVFGIDAERNLLLLKGSVPGARGGILLIRTVNRG